MDNLKGVSDSQAPQSAKIAESSLVSRIRNATRPKKICNGLNGLDDHHEDSSTEVKTLTDGRPSSEQGPRWVDCTHEAAGRHQDMYEAERACKGALQGMQDGHRKGP